MIANQQGIANAVKAASNPTSSSYGKYLSLSTLQNKYGASSSRRKAVVGAFKNYGVTATVDVTHLRVGATISVKNAQKLFGTKWNLYATGQKNQAVALPVNTPKLGSGLSGNVDTVSGLALYVTQHASASSARPRRRRHRRRQARAAAVAGGTPTRTGTINPGCASTTYPGAVFSTAGLFPNQILTAYGIASMQASGLQGQGMRVAILGEAPTPTQRRHRVPQLLRLSGDHPEDPRRLGHRADPRELAGRDDDRDGRPEALAPGPVGQGAWAERPSGRAGAAGRAATGDDERHPAAERDLDLLRRVRGQRRALHRRAHAV